MEALRRLLPEVAVVQTTQAGTGSHGRAHCRPFLDRAPARRVLFQGIVNAVLVVVVHVIANQPPEMLFVQRDDMIENLAAGTSGPSFSDSILPWRLDTRPLGLQTGGFQERDDIGVKLRIAVEDDVSDTGLPRETLHAVVGRPTPRSGDGSR